MDPEDWESDGEFEATITDMDAKEANSLHGPSISKVIAEPIQLPTCSTPRSHPKISDDISLSLSTISYVKSPSVIDKSHSTRKDQDEKSSSGKKKRKFPGPAGALPKLKKDVDLRSLKDSCVVTHNEDENTEVASSQSSQQLSVSSYPSWNRLVEDMELSRKHLNKHSISNALHNASKRQLPEGKVPLLATVVISINKSLPDATVTLKDLTGTINGVIHRLLMKEHREGLKVGSALLLKQVAVFSPSRRRQYLNITPNNLLHVYFEHEKTADIESKSVAKLTVPLETLLTQPVSCSPPKPASADCAESTLADRESRLFNTVSSNTFKNCSTPIRGSSALAPLTERVNHTYPSAQDHRPGSVINDGLSKSNQQVERHIGDSLPVMVKSATRLTNASASNVTAVTKLNDTNQDMFDDDDLDDLDLDF